MEKRSAVYILLKALIFLGVYSAFHFGGDVLRLPVFTVSESPWEHFKAGFYAASLLVILEALRLGIKREVFSWGRFFTSRLTGVLIIPVLLFLLFYLSVALWGKIIPAWLGIAYAVAITLLSGLTAAYVENELLDFRWEHKPILLLLAVIVYIIALYLFIQFTYHVPYYPMFTER
ncbi:MAG: hypothetical protein GXY92_10470 [Syntrophomonadaceae bacterium]|nr:hypothetical protein [Syntrophomonadaceae bacterium]